MGASVFAAKRGGTVVTCAATSGYMVEFDNRHFWMKLKKLVASHFANYEEAWAANRLIDQGRIHPLLSGTYALDEVGEAALGGPPQRGRGQARRAVPRPRRRVSASTTRKSATASARRTSPASRSETAAVTASRR